MKVVAREQIAPAHPATCFKELLDELELSQYRQAQDIRVTGMRVNHIVRGQRPVTAEFTLRLDRYFKQSPRFWLNLQSRYDKDVTEDQFGKRVAEEVQPCKAVA